MRPFIDAKMFKFLGGNDAGVSLIETLIALALLGLIATAFLSGLFTASKATFIADERATAESLARSELEYVKSQGYIDYSDLGHGSYELIKAQAIDNYNYDIYITATPIDPNTGQPLSEGRDQGIQKITVAVEHDGESVLTVDGYKVDRYEAE